MRDVDILGPLREHLYTHDLEGTLGRVTFTADEVHVSIAAGHGWPVFHAWAASIGAADADRREFTYSTDYTATGIFADGTRIAVVYSERRLHRRQSETTAVPLNGAAA